MKRWYSVTIRSFDPADRDLCWSERASAYSTEAECVATAFRQINRPSRNTKVFWDVETR